MKTYTSLTIEQQNAVDKLIEKSGGILEVMHHFGWQGGTIHQVRDETIRRLHCTDIAIGIDGELYDLSKSPVKEG